MLEASSVHLLWRNIQMIFQCFPYPEPKHILFVINWCENFNVCWDARKVFRSSFIWNSSVLKLGGKLCLEQSLFCGLWCFLLEKPEILDKIFSDDLLIQLVIIPNQDMDIEMEEIAVEKSISINLHQHQNDISQKVSLSFRQLFEEAVFFSLQYNALLFNNLKSALLMCSTVINLVLAKVHKVAWDHAVTNSVFFPSLC